MTPPDQQPITLTRAELREVVADAVSEAFIRLGVDVSDPLEMQHDFQHLREWRTSVDGVKKKGVMTIIGVFIAGIAAMIWLGLKHALLSP